MTVLRLRQLLASAGDDCVTALDDGEGLEVDEEFADEKMWLLAGLVPEGFCCKLTIFASFPFGPSAKAGAWLWSEACANWSSVL